MTPQALFERCGRAICGDGSAWKVQFGQLLGVKTDSIDAFAKGEKRIPPGIWFAIIGEIRRLREGLASLEQLSLAVSEIVKLRPLRVDLNGTHMIRDGATELSRGSLEECHRWLDLQQEEALLKAVAFPAPVRPAILDLPDGLGDVKPARFLTETPRTGHSVRLLLPNRGEAHGRVIVAGPTRMEIAVGDQRWFLARELADDAGDPHRERWVIGGQA